MLMQLLSHADVHTHRRRGSLSRQRDAREVPSEPDPDWAGTAAASHPPRMPLDARQAGSSAARLAAAAAQIAMSNNTCYYNKERRMRVRGPAVVPTRS